MFTKNNLKTNAVAEAVAKILEAELDEGSGPKEKQKTPYRNINSTEYKAAADKQKEKMKKDDASEPGKKLLGRQHKLDKNHNGKLDAHDFKLLRGEKNESVEELDELSKGTLLSYVKKADKQQGKNFDDIVAAHKDNNQPKATKANAKYINRERGQDRAVSKMYAKYDKPKTEAVEKPTHILSKELVSDHKRWMDSEGFDTHTVPLPKSHPKHKTHVGIVAKNNNEAGYHEDGFARPIHESVESIDEISTAQMGHAGKTTLKHIKNPGVGLRMAAHDVKPGIKGYRDRVDLMRAADAEGKLKKEAAEDLEEKKGDSDLGTFTDNNMGEMTDAQMKKRETIVKGMKKGLAGFKERYGKRAKDVMYATATKQAMKDEAVDPKAKTTDTLAGRIKGGESNLHTSYKVKLKTEAMGCENTPMSRATNLAKAAYKKLKNETMMGKAGGTSEEKE